MCAILYFFLMVCNKPHANPTIIYENIKEIHILAVGGIPGISYFMSHASPPWNCPVEVASQSMPFQCGTMKSFYNSF